MSQPEKPQDDFIIIVLKGSKLQASGKAKLGTEWLPGDLKEYKSGYRFAKSHEEVIVEDFIHSEAILGFTSTSELVEFMPGPGPPQCQNPLERKQTFQESLPPEVDKFDCAVAQKSLLFALALLAPMLVLGEQQRTNIGSAEGASVSPKVNPRSDHEDVSGQRGAEDEYVLIQNLP